MSVNEKWVPTNILSPEEPRYYWICPEGNYSSNCAWDFYMPIAYTVLVVTLVGSVLFFYLRRYYGYMVYYRADGKAPSLPSAAPGFVPPDFIDQIEDFKNIITFAPSSVQSSGRGSRNNKVNVMSPPQVKSMI